MTCSRNGSRPTGPPDGKPITLVAFTITSAKIVAIDLIDDPNRIAEADLAILGH